MILGFASHEKPKGHGVGTAVEIIGGLILGVVVWPVASFVILFVAFGVLGMLEIVADIFGYDFGHDTREASASR